MIYSAIVPLHLIVGLWEEVPD